jgi:putative membrane protein
MNIISRLAAKLEDVITEAKPPSAAKPPEDFNTLLSIERTNLAQERTIMAWVRTATSLISFGFTIYKFFQLEAKGHVSASQVIGPRTFALLMILMGLFGW